MEINIDNWKEFEISKLFEYERGKESAPNQNQDGDCRLLSETQDNNGFVRLVKPTKIIHGHCLTVSVNYASTVFYQEEDFCASVNIIVLRPKAKITKNQLLFISTILSKKHESYSYTDKVSKNLLMKETIKLPSTYNVEKEEYEPDWNYMEDFIKEIKEENEIKLASLKTLFNPENMRGGELDVSDWKEFEVGKLFKVINSKPYHKNEVIVADKEDLSSVNYITRSKFDNGLLYKVEDNKKFDKNPKNTISFGAENADFFIQLEEYVTGNKMYYIDTQKLTLNQSLFFKTVLQKTLTNRYGFNDGLTGERLKTEKILLPATYNKEKEKYEPNWEYMENFITNLQEVAKNQLRRLKQENE